ncbi:IS4 family transposase [Spirosoma litoris]
MNTAKLPVKTLLGYLPDELLDALAIEYQVDKHVKKLRGTLVFKLLLYAVLATNELSLNVLIALLEKVGIRQLIGVDAHFTTQRNSVADRLAQLDCRYLEAIFKQLIKLVNQHWPTPSFQGYQLHLVDSTLVACSAKLLSIGIQLGRKAKDESHRYKHIKFSIGYDGLKPETIRFYDQQTHASDETPLKETIQSLAFSAKDVAVFDAGLQNRLTFEQFTKPGEGKRFFVTRLKANSRYQCLTEQPLAISTDTLVLETELGVRLYTASNRLIADSFRLIKAHLADKPEQSLLFLTNLPASLSALEVSQIYRQRWQIEKFFRFIKQQMNFSHFLSRSSNGIKLMAYVMLIGALLIGLYGRFNGRSGFKITKLLFFYELEADLLKAFIEECQGDPALLDDA